MFVVELFAAVHRADAWSIYYVACVFTNWFSIFFSLLFALCVLRVYNFERDKIEINHSFNCWHYRMPSSDKRKSARARQTECQLISFFLLLLPLLLLVSFLSFRACPFRVNWFHLSISINSSTRSYTFNLIFISKRLNTGYLICVTFNHHHHLSQSIFRTFAPHAIRFENISQLSVSGRE